MPAIKIKKSTTKRGDTFIEVMFAIAVFSLVAVLSVAMMNAGIATSERSLELVTARNELNAQAEALRFVHNAYTAELNLPECSEVPAGQKCQRYQGLWGKIIGNAMEPYKAGDEDNASRYSIPSPLTSCQVVYEDDNKILDQNHAFVLNTRAINSNPEASYIPSNKKTSTNAFVFQEAPLNARMIFVAPNEEYKEDASGNSESSAGVMSTANSLRYNQVGRAEGIWVVAVKDEQERYYDFYIQTCWYGTGMRAPTTLDTIVRLYNPAKQ